MRNWNDRFRIILDYPTPWKFWVYLWGIETKRSIGSNQSRLSWVLSLPMRNWNKGEIKEGKQLLSCFESTYEELKPPSSPSFATSDEYSFWVYLWGIETKIYHLLEGQNYQVLSLPMRNWNIPLAFILFTSLSVLSLPMRNWNFCDTDCFQKFQFVLSLPMRNWNKCFL